MVITPVQFLTLLALVSAACGLVRLVRRRRQVSRLRALAVERRLHFTPIDRFRLFERIAPAIDTPGAASLHVSDLLYGIEGEHYRYLFCAQYTLGVLHGRSGIRRIGRLIEPRPGSSRTEAARISFAPPSLALLEQYRHLLDDPAEG